MNQSAIDATESQAFGLMGRLHVLLRREIGRVTDVKYMGSNAEYCKHVLELAASVSNPDLNTICARLEAIYFGDKGLFKDSQYLLRKTAMVSSSRTLPGEPQVHNVPVLDAAGNADQHYVGRLR